MNRIVLSTTLTLAAVTPFAMRGADYASTTPTLDLAAPSPENPNRFSFGPTFGLNFKADFHNNVNPGPAAGSYNDGYVLADSSGPPPGSTTTWNWGYKNASQFNMAGDTMQFHAVQLGGSSSDSGNPQYGGEFIYQRVIGSLPFLSGDWGLEAGFGFTELDLRENLNGTVPVTTDAYQLDGVVPPGAGYNGTFQGPGALLGNTPITATTTSATLTGYQRLSGQLFSLRLGPFAEWKLTDKLSLAASVGLTLAPAVVDYDFSETATLAGGDTITESGHSSKTELLYGPYAGAMLRYDFNRCWGVYVGARFQNLTDLEQSVGSRTARLNPSATVYATAGVSWKF
jgi:hypothetical protein